LPSPVDAELYTKFCVVTWGGACFTHQSCHCVCTHASRGLCVACGNVWFLV